MPRRRTAFAAALPVLVAVAGGTALALRGLRRDRRANRRAAGHYKVLADMGRIGFRAVIWDGTSATEALRLATSVSTDFGRTWVEGPDGKTPARP
jgi:hypothetical protein